jgi:hypothetical protein
MGPNAQAIQHNHPTAAPTALAEAVTRLRQAIEAASFPEKPRVERDLKEIEAEVVLADADTSRMGDALSRISRRTAQIGGIATVVAQVGELIRQFPH